MVLGLTLPFVIGSDLAHQTANDPILLTVARWDQPMPVNDFFRPFEPASFRCVHLPVFAIALASGTYR
jgi:hypothetical protein